MGLEEMWIKTPEGREVYIGIDEDGFGAESCMDLTANDHLYISAYLVAYLGAKARKIPLTDESIERIANNIYSRIHKGKFSELRKLEEVSDKEFNRRIREIVYGED